MQTVIHSVECISCGRSPFTGLRYQCTRCPTAWSHQCQECFWRCLPLSKSHKSDHEVREYHTAVSLKIWLVTLHNSLTFQFVHAALTLLVAGRRGKLGHFSFLPSRPKERKSIQKFTLVISPEIAEAFIIRVYAEAVATLRPQSGVGRARSNQSVAHFGGTGATRCRDLHVSRYNRVKLCKAMQN